MYKNKHKAAVKKEFYIFILVVIALLMAVPSEAQFRSSSSAPPTYEGLYDDPYGINKLFVHFQPLYFDGFATNVNLGFGLEANYYWEDKMHFRAHGRTTYSHHTDFTRATAQENLSDLQVYTPSVYNYFEVGATYHIKDEEQDTETKFILYSKRYKGKKWAAKVPDHIKAPTKVRKIIGARLGGISYKSSFDLRRVVEDQAISLADPTVVAIDPNGTLYGNVSALGGYVGASLTTIKNVAIKFDKTYGMAISDLIFNAYFDVLVMPMIELDDIRYRSTPSSSLVTLPPDPISTSMIGGRLGIEGKFNRTFGWGYNGEIGLRPGVGGKNFYALIRISFPVYATSLSHEVEAFGK